MKLHGKEYVYLQCQKCGHVYLVKNLSISDDDSIVKHQCPMCENNTALNVGHNKEDIYMYYNVNLDNRYF